MLQLVVLALLLCMSGEQLSHKHDQQLLGLTQTTSSSLHATQTACQEYTLYQRTHTEVNLA